MTIKFYGSGGEDFAAECGDACVTDGLDGARKSLSFTLGLRLLPRVRPEMTALCGGTRYALKEVRLLAGADRLEAGCVIDTSELDGAWIRGFAPPDLPYGGHEGVDYGDDYGQMADPLTPAYCAQDVVSGLYHAGHVPDGWTFRYLVPPPAPGQEPVTGQGLLFLNGVFEADGMTLTEAIAKLAGMVQGCGGSYAIDNVGRVVTLGAVGFGERPYGHAVPFILGHNLRSFTRTEDSRGIVTRLYAYGKDGLDLSPVCGGREYVEDLSYTGRAIAASWTNTDIQDAANLKEAALERLSVISRPAVSYGVDIIDLAGIRPDAAALAYSVGMYARLQDAATGTDDRMRIVRTVSYPDSPERNTIELSSPVPTLEDIAASWSRVVNDDGTVNGVRVRGVRVGDVVGIETAITEDGKVRRAVESVVRDVVGG